ncbi:MAG: phosphoribosylglycinamide formyltransferase [Candidatus Marinimicrobia bacterium]|nr:phosphoribosylglycinamide formyltransferase [Candidatus Neomarinimicrobiota bacterium]OUW50871.1 MAG: phosphoribosylglycinamide formyltransferase [bacterium TMED190]|tara:strand:- start:17837 stop:18430 length:594 start_codon:yes stop_codon:yes gene_type:complete
MSLKIGVLGSSNGTDLDAIIDSIEKKYLDAEIKLIISNVKTALILEKAKNNNIKSLYISHKKKSREIFDNELSGHFKNEKVDLILLIGFMRILSSNFCNEWNNKILNVHPSLLPKYSGLMDLNIHKKVIENNESETGCTIHFVTKDLDKGPILVQKKCFVSFDETPLSLKKKVQKLEGISFIEAIKIFKKELITNEN